MTVQSVHYKIHILCRNKKTKIVINIGTRPLIVLLFLNIQN